MSDGGRKGTHFGVFPINPAREAFPEPITFRPKCVPLRPPGPIHTKRWGLEPRLNLPKRCAMGKLRLVGIRGSAHPPEGNPGRKDPERRSTDGWRATGTATAPAPVALPVGAKHAVHCSKRSTRGTPARGARATGAPSPHGGLVGLGSFPSGAGRGERRAPAFRSLQKFWNRESRFSGRRMVPLVPPR